MDEAVKQAGVEAPATSTTNVDGVKVVIDRSACASWDAIMLSRDIQKLHKQFGNAPEGDKQAEIVVDAVSLMYEYVLLVTDLSREKINAHLGDKASFESVSRFLGRVMSETKSKN